MRDTELYRQLLGVVEPWKVQSVELNISKGKVDIELEHREGIKWPCPECGNELAIYDHAEERTWRHLDTCQFKTYVHARIPRVDCDEHGVRRVKVPWAEKGSRFTLLMERLVIDVLTETATVEGAKRLLGLSWDEVHGVMKRAVKRGKSRKKRKPPALIGVDEKSFRKRHKYVTVVCDLEAGTVEHVSEGRTTESLKEYYSSLSAEERNGIEAVAMDMWPAYIAATREWIPDADERIVFDRFHVMAHMEKAVDAVRKREHRELSAVGDDTLKGTKWMWLYNMENVPDKHRPLLEFLRDLNLKISRAWAIKETLRGLWNYLSEGWAQKFFAKWYSWAVRSRLKPVREVARMIRNHIKGIINYCRVPITNAAVEGLNSRIAAIKQRACGFRNMENFKMAIYFFCGGLNLYPL
jgi:transposase